MNRHYPGVADRAGHRCEYCRAPEAIFNLAFEVEHIIPTSDGGPDDESNLALACRACNLYKSDQQVALDEMTQEVVHFFHPQRDRWHDHFCLEPPRHDPRPTPTGIVTVARLRMNRDIPRDARRSWMRPGLYP